MEAEESNRKINKMPQGMGSDDGEVEKTALEIYREFSVLEWTDWVEDLLNYQFAYPMPSISAELDLIVEMPKHLRSSDISINKYESAVCNLLEQLNSRDSNPFHLEILVRTIRVIKGQRGHSILIKILTAKRYNHKVGRFGYIKTTALSALVSASGLEESKIQEISKYIEIGKVEMKHDPVFFGNALSFYRIKSSIELFFVKLSPMIRMIDTYFKENGNSVWIDECVIVLFDRIKQARQESIHVFNGLFFHWYLENESLKGQYVFEKVTKKLYELITFPLRASGVSQLEDVFFQEDISLERDTTEFSEYHIGLCIFYVMDMAQGRKDEFITSKLALLVIAFLLSNETKLPISKFRKIHVRNHLYFKTNFEELDRLVEPYLEPLPFREKVVKEVLTFVRYITTCVKSVGSYSEEQRRKTNGYSSMKDLGLIGRSSMRRSKGKEEENV